jgi:hypothetical protein
VVGLVANRFPGTWDTLPTLRQQTTTDLIAATEYAGADVRVMVTGQRGTLNHSPINARIRIIATQRDPNTIERFHTINFPTGIKEAGRDVLEIAISPDIALAIRMDGSLLNEALVTADAKTYVDRIIAGYAAGAQGVGIAHGVKAARALKHPVGAVQSMEVIFGLGSFDYFIGTQIDLGAPAPDDVTTEARRTALGEDAWRSLHGG